jgi:hypothetical protein
LVVEEEVVINLTIVVAVEILEGQVADQMERVVRDLGHLGKEIRVDLVMFLVVMLAAEAVALAPWDQMQRDLDQVLVEQVLFLQ